MAVPGTMRALLDALQGDSLSAEAAVRDCLDRIAKLEADVQAWAWLDPDAALAAARMADGRAEKGPLHGIPFGIKDVLDTGDMPTTYGSPIYEGHRPCADAAAVAAIRDAGGIILGKTVTCEFAGGLPSRTRNPRALGHTPGGSSSGSAAAVAAGMIPVALGTQTAGSIIRPASFCGVVGYKPTFGRINRAGLKPFSESVDTIGLFGRCVDDVALAAAAIGEHPDLDENFASAPARILLCRTDMWRVAEHDGRQALENAAALISQAGGTLLESPLPFACAEVIAAGAVVIATEARRAFRQELRTAPEHLSGQMHAFLARGEAGRSGRYGQAVAILEGARLDLDGLLGGADVIMTLSAPGEAPQGFASTGDATFAMPWTMLHAPAITIPGLSGSRGLPVGIQLIGRRHADASLLKIARWVEAVLSVQTRRAANKALPAARIHPD